MEGIHLPVPARVLLFDVTLLKNPVGHDPHSGWAVAEPAAVVYLPGGHLVWARQASMLLLEAKALKNPVAHASHSESVLTEPPTRAYLPGGHLVWLVQASVMVVLFEAEALKNPFGHNAHSGWALAVPATSVYLPGGHLLWAVHHSKGQSIAEIAQVTNLIQVCNRMNNHCVILLNCIQAVAKGLRAN